MVRGSGPGAGAGVRGVSGLPRLWDALISIKLVFVDIFLIQAGFLLERVPPPLPERLP